MMLIDYCYFVDVSRVVIVSNNFSATEIFFWSKPAFDFKYNLPNYDLVIAREDFDLKSILFNFFFIKNPIKFISKMNVWNEACCAY